MGTSKVVYGLVAFVSLILGIILFFIDGTLLWPIGFFSLGVILILFSIMWDISGWADNVVRKLGDDDAN